VQLGFIGLGAMGRAMVANLLRARHRVTVWNRTPGPAEALRALGAEVAAEPGDAMVGEALLTMLADDDAVRQVILEGGVLDGGSSGRTAHVNMATVSVAFAREMAALHAARGVPYLSAPVFGRTEVAAAGKLQVLTAGDAALVDRLAPVFAAIGQRTWYFGPDPARANTVKIAGNLMVACAIEALGEAVALAEAGGVAPSDLVEVLTQTIFSSPVYEGYGRLIASRRYEPPAFTLRLGLKDVRLALAAGDAVGLPLPFASVLRDNLLDAIAHGNGEKDWSALAEVAARRGGLRGGEIASPRDAE